MDARPVALIEGRSVTWGELRPGMTEISGAQALDEHILDLKLQAALQEAGLKIDATDLQRERQVLLEQLDPDPNRALRLLDELRSRRGLGPYRFERLLRRNAALRALVQEEIDVTPAMLQQQFELQYGPRRQARIIVLPTLYDAQRTLEAIARRSVDFADEAVRRSTDQSASRGGLLEPISRADPSYPEALRRALWELEPGATSRPILLDGQYALLRLEREVAAKEVRMEQVSHELTRFARLGQERLAMDRLALSLISNVQVTIFDETLNDSWQRRVRGASGPNR